ncbi:MAG: threonine dehydratase, partial [Comamonadaceae bacterium]
MHFTRDEIADAQRIVYAALPPTPQYAWPLLAQALNADVWVQHENHTPAGAFKIRGGLTYFDTLARQRPDIRHVISATRGNHGQSVGFAARRHGLAATIVVPHGNSAEKNAAMRALGVNLVEHGDDFQAASEHATVLADTHQAHRIPSFHRELVRGVATAYVEFFEAMQDAPPEVLYVPIGLGSGFAAAAAARAHVGVKTRLVGVVSAH